jgi:hypothetical protein
MRYKIRSSTKDFSRKQHHLDDSLKLRWMVDIALKFLNDPRETFKVALLCKDTHARFQSSGLTDFATLAADYAKRRVVQSLNELPTFEKYQKNRIKICEAIKSPVFGGSVFTPTKGAESGAGGLKETRNDGKASERKSVGSGHIGATNWASGRILRD